MQLKVQSLSYTLSLLRWDIFTTLTFKKVPSEKKAWGAAWAHLRCVANQFTDVPYSRLMIVLRSELGELGGRFHFHYLLGGTGVSNYSTLAHQVASQWRTEMGSLVDARPYDRNQAGAEYVVKCLSGANDYERSKFDRAGHVEVSDAVFRVVKRMRSFVEPQARLAHSVKREGDDPSTASFRSAIEPLKTKFSHPSDEVPTGVLSACLGMTSTHVLPFGASGSGVKL